MATDKKSNSVKRFGARYGRNIKRKFGLIEKEQRKLHKCPYCSAEKVKRKFLGVWECKKCGKIFANKAYTVSKVKKDKSVQDYSVEVKPVNLKKNKGE